MDGEEVEKTEAWTPSTCWAHTGNTGEGTITLLGYLNRCREKMLSY